MSASRLISGLISDVASLWILALVVVVFVLAVIFRQPLARLIDRGGVRLQRGQTTFEISAERETPAHNGREVRADGEQMARPEETEEDDGKPQSPSELVEEVEAGGDREDERTWIDVFRLLDEGKIDEARAVFGELQQRAGENGDDKLRNEVVFAYSRNRWANDPAALNELEDFAADERVASLALTYIGHAHEEDGYADRALESFERARDLARDEDDRATAVLGASRALEALDRRDEAIQRLRHALTAAESDSERARYYDGLAEMYKRADDRLMRAYALEKALESAPTSSKRRFETGYAYAEAGTDDLALLHYAAALRIDASDVHARNNIGVAYERLGMPIKSVRSYRRAAETYHTLAMANLAHRFLNGGFVDEARQVLKDAATRPDPHANVGTNLAEANRLEDVEQERETRLLKEAEKKRAYIRRFASALNLLADLPQIAGSWIFADGTRAAIVQEGSTFTLAYEAKGKRIRLEGTITNGSLRFSYLVEQYSFTRTPPGPEYTKKGEGRGYLDGEAKIELVIEESGEERFETLRRTPISEAPQFQPQA